MMDTALQTFPKGLPTLDQLIEHNKDKDVIPETSWIWGKDDEVGRLNLLTSERIAAAKDQEISHGIVVSLNWPLNLPAKPAFGRTPCNHRMENHPDGPMVFDDWINMNVQCGSQWDGFRHYGHFQQKRFYNNLTPEEVKTGTRCGIQAASDHGIVGRGVLLDYYGWKIAKGEQYDPFTSHAIHVNELLEVANSQEVQFQEGDILLIRSGYTSAYYHYQKTNPEKLEQAGSFTPTLAGVAQTPEMKKWLHDSYFSAVAGDAPSFECWPPTSWALHEYILSCWGMLIGEMFDLETLAQRCREAQKWSFFFVSMPLNNPGGVASTANAMAIL